jgi:four helix bundle protein
MIASYRDLRVWQAAMQMVEHVYSATRLFPPGEMYGLAAQLRRAAVSVPSNIAEGHVRSYTREFLIVYRWPTVHLPNCRRRSK